MGANNQSPQKISNDTKEHFSNDSSKQQRDKSKKEKLIINTEAEPYKIKDIDEKKIGHPHVENKYWKMVREGLTRSLTEAFKQNLIDCHQVIVQQSGHTIVHEAVVLDRHELFKLCEVYGADWDKRDKNGVTPLMKAVALNRIFYIQKLIELGADKQIKDNQGRTAMDYGQLYQNFQAMDLLE